MFKLFKKKTTKTIIGLDSLYEPPKRDSLNEEELILLEEIKDKFNEILRQNKTIVSDELDFNDLYDSITMNTDLLFSTVISDPFKTSLQVAPERYDKVTLLKLQIYKEEIKKLEKEAELKLIALTEIYEKKKFFISPSKASAIKNAIYTLKNTTIIFKSQERSIELKIESFLKDIEFNQEQENLLELKFIQDIASSVISDKVSKLQNKNISGDIKIALLIRELEIYAYKHKDDVDKLEEELNRIYTNTTRKNIGNSLTQIRALEYKFLALAKFGKRIITEEFMETFYRVKMYVLGMSLTNMDDKIIYVKPFEKKVYEKVIFEHIHAVLTSDLPKDVIKGFKNFIRPDDDNSKINPEEILENPCKLGIVLNLLDRQSMISFMENFYIDFNNPSIDIREGFTAYKIDMKISEMAPLKTFIWLIANSEYEYSISKFLSGYLEYMDSEKYYIPEGILDIGSIGLDLYIRILYTPHILKQLRKEAQDKIIILPEGMEGLDSVATGVRFKGIEAPSTFKQLVLYADTYSYHLKKLTIPSTMVSIKCNNIEAIDHLCIYETGGIPWEGTIALKDLFYTVVYYDRDNFKRYTWVESIIDELTIIKEDGRSVTIKLSNECSKDKTLEEYDANHFMMHVFYGALKEPKKYKGTRQPINQEDFRRYIDLLSDKVDKKFKEKYETKKM